MILHLLFVVIEIFIKMFLVKFKCFLSQVESKWGVIEMMDDIYVCQSYDISSICCPQLFRKTLNTSGSRTSNPHEMSVSNLCRKSLCFHCFFFQPKCPILRLVIRDGMIHDPICMKLVHCLASTSPYLVWYKSEISTIFGLSLPLFGANASPRAVIISLLPVIPGRYLALFLTDISRMDQNN